MNFFVKYKSKNVQYPQSLQNFISMAIYEHYCEHSDFYQQYYNLKDLCFTIKTIKQRHNGKYYVRFWEQSEFEKEAFISPNGKVTTINTIEPETTVNTQVPR